ncbi:NAD(P)-binding-like protein [Thermothelomyces thermophilus ATCC 42464]|uniref:NAD(P)-binding-like protein n=1 Tax=Thermothelomyces thermophilus (strain ATCC 42464 / BCRC 31852 / DSM 1799) TaxID=573729 RepID=G2PZJ8_THET4|nr:NAD(P)-binding-like protein [Thermothelomyces thermophilus ATCC 42464]AEO55684.1 NAD(P)-binding-like protein [Thermothelomyces thermophilus ATCC 42464]
MNPFQGLREYERSSPWPEKTPISIRLKDGLSITLTIPNFGVAARTDDQVGSNATLTRVALAHAAFKSALQPEAALDDSFFKTCVAEVNVIKLFFPDITSEAVLIVFTAWLAFACAMDDVIETLDLGDRELVLWDSIQLLIPTPDTSLQRSESLAPEAKDKRVQALARALLDHCTRYLSPKSADAFFNAVCRVLEAHAAEVGFLQGRNNDSFAEYLSVRSRTIALSPFFEVIKAEYLAEPDWDFNDAWLGLQDEVSRAAGLQNDLIGLLRDIEDGEQLNAVVILMRGFRGYDANRLDRNILARCVSMVAAEHNASAARCFERMTELHRAAQNSPGSSVERVEKVARHIIMMCETHLRWCSSSKRYRLEIAVDENYTSPSSSAPNTPATTAAFPSGEAQSLESCASQSRETQAHPEQAVVHSAGIFHGLPSYPDTPECRNLTALVTGATGLSGYHMVKVLAALPQRWRKIYCLSSRAPPPNFFEDLGEGSSRVEHLAVNFLDDPSEIAQRLREKIVEHVLHPRATSWISGQTPRNWRLSTRNTENMFNNFIAALQLTSLRPRRFMLQTGSKHYAFYLGPAFLPAFESDPRVLLDRNFYYEQEDALNVARPSYIVGAVRDGTLNHLIGFGIYAAVQAFLGEPIAFPGDYHAWDREQVQSTGMLNAYFEEWLVLTGKTANEAFNIHDGQSFTWGRLWPYLASWYQAEWLPPAEEEDKYRSVKLPCPTTPRGYGPQATLRSTFSLLEWSLQPRVEEAWKDLAKRHGLVLDPFDDRYRARIFSFSDSAVIGDAPMTTSVRKAREFGFFGTVDSYRSIFDTFHDLARLKLIPAPAVKEFTA